MNDKQALQLLQLLNLYVTSYSPDIPQTLSALAEDLVTSLGEVSMLAEAEGLLDSIRSTAGVS